MEHETTEKGESSDGLLRRTVLRAGALAAGALVTAGPVASKEIENEADERNGNENANANGDRDTTDDEGASDEETGDEETVDSPEGFGVSVLAPHANFTDDVAAKFRVKYDEGDRGTIVSDLPRDASSVVVARATWEPQGTTGWHTHPGPAIVSITAGELELQNARDCVARTYEAGEAFIDPGQGNVHTARNPSEEDEAEVYVTFLGVPDGEPATIWVEPADCGADRR